MNKIKSHLLIYCFILLGCQLANAQVANSQALKDNDRWLFADQLIIENIDAVKPAGYGHYLLESPLSLKKCGFWEKVSGKNILFKKPVYFTNAAFHGESVFDQCIFEEEVDYSRSIFYYQSKFKDLNFKQKVNFQKTVFHKGASFKKIKFDGEVNFFGANFGKELVFEWVTFKKAPDFREILLPRWLSFINVNLDSLTTPIDLTKVKKDSPICKIYIAKTYLHKIKLDYQYFELLLWKNKNIRGFIDFKAYNWLLQKQKEWGFEEGYQKLKRDLEKFKKERDAKWSEWSEWSESEGNPDERDPQIDSILADIAKEQEEQERKLAKRISININPVPVLGTLIILAVIISFIVFIVRYLRNATDVSSSPVSTYQAEPTQVKGNEVKQRKKELEQIQKNVLAGETLWQRHHTAEGDLNKPEKFWLQYEKLLQKAKQKH